MAIGWSRPMWAGLATGMTVSAALIYAAYRRDMREAVRRISSMKKIIDTPLGPIEYADIGQGPVVLMVHGAAGGFDQGVLIAKQAGLVEGHRIVAPSRFGYLGTPVPPGEATPATQADAHEYLLTALGIDGPVAVIGTSAGAASAMQFAIKYPKRVAALVLQVPAAWAPLELQRTSPAKITIGSSLLDRVMRRDFIVWVFMKLAKANMLAVMGLTKEILRRTSQQELENAEDLMRAMLPMSRRHRGITLDVAVNPPQERYSLEEIRVPTLIIDAKDVTTYPGSAYSAEHIANARLMSFETGGHLLAGHSSEANAAVREFLGQHLRETMQAGVD